MNLLFKIVFVLTNINLVLSVEFKYHTNEELEQILLDFPDAVSEPLRARTHSIGTTLEGNKLWVTEITATPPNALNIPNVKLIANIHGDEVVGRVVLLHFLYYLKTEYLKNDTITWLLNNTRIHIMPTMNPDGFNMSKVDTMCHNNGKGRNNGKTNVDLNRSFPDYYHNNVVPAQLETRAMIKWMQTEFFILSASLHGGAVVANYPFDTIKERHSNYHQKPLPSLTPDNDVFVHLAKTYSENHAVMHLGRKCKGSSFEGGITNGAKWYMICGSMQDYNYFKHGCMEITLEISCCKYPPAKELQNLWEENKNALVAFCMQAHKGIAGQILDEQTNQPVGNANIKIDGREMNFTSFWKTGEYRRILLPGVYTMEIRAHGYYPTYKTINLTENFSIMNVYLKNASIRTTTPTPVKSTTYTLKTNEHVSEMSSVRTSSLDEYLTEAEGRAEELKSSSGNTNCYSIICIFVCWVIIFRNEYVHY